MFMEIYRKRNNNSIQFNSNFIPFQMSGIGNVKLQNFIIV